MKIRFKYFWFVLILAAFVWLHAGRFGEFPIHVHAWTQTDRLALAYCYVDNGLDLWHPCTSNLETIEGITAVDLPLTEYLAAVLISISGHQSPAYLHLIHLLLILGAFFALRKLADKLGLDERGVAVVSGFFLFSPVLSYYTIGIIPSIPALAFFVISLYYLELFFRRNKLSDVLWLSLFMSLSALIRKPYILHAIALFVGFAFLHFKKMRSFQKRDLMLLIIPLSFLLWNLWSAHLKSTYGSAFLGNIMPPANFERFVELLVASYRNWQFDYLSGIQYAWLAMLLGANVWQQKGLKARSKELAVFNRFLGISGLFYFILMARQFEHHDYYMLDALFPALLLMTVNLYPRFRESFSCLGKWFGIFGSIAVCFWIVNANTCINKRSQGGFWNRIEQSYLNFQASASWLDAYVSREEKLLIPDAYTTNSALVLSGRKGYSSVLTNDSVLNELVKKDAEYMVLQNQYILSDVLPHRPSLVNEFEFVTSNSYLSLYKRSIQDSDLEDFLGFEDALDLEAALLQKVKTSDGLIENLGDSLIRLKNNTEFGFNFAFKFSKLYVKHVEVKPKNAELYWVYRLAGQEESTGVNTKYYAIQSQSGQFLNLPEHADLMELYLWNPGLVAYEIIISEMYAE